MRHYHKTKRHAIRDMTLFLLVLTVVPGFMAILNGLVWQGWAYLVVMSIGTALVLCVLVKYLPKE